MNNKMIITAGVFVLGIVILFFVGQFFLQQQKQGYSDKQLLQEKVLSSQLKASGEKEKEDKLISCYEGVDTYVKKEWNNYCKSYLNNMDNTDNCILAIFNEKLAKSLIDKQKEGYDLCIKTYK
jgi:hypothetical protein